MYRINWMPDGGCALLDNDKVYVFNRIGQCVKEKEPMLQAYTMGMVELPILSLLTCNGYYEIAVFDGDNFKCYQPKCEPQSNIAMLLNARGKFLRMLTRRGSIQGYHGSTDRFNQLIFVYPAGTDIRSLLGDLI